MATENDIQAGIRLTGDASGLKAAFKDAEQGATRFVDVMDDVGQHVTEATDALGPLPAAIDKSDREFRVGAQAARMFAQATAETAQSTRALLDKYDPLSAKLRTLKADFAALSNAAKNGEVGPQDDARTDAVYARLNNEIKAVQAQMLGVGPAAAKGLGEAAAHAEKSAFATAGARRELIVLGHEAVSGNFSRMPGSFMVLAERMGSVGGAALKMGGIIAGVVSVGLLFANAYAQGVEEVRHMNDALDITSGYAGRTRVELRELAKDMSDSGGVSISIAKSLVTELARSGQIGSMAFDQIAKASEDFAAATGRDVAKVGPELVKLFSDPIKGAQELNREMHFLSVTDMERIATLQHLGEVSEAQLLLAQKLTDHLPKQYERLGLLEKAWIGVTHAASNAWDAMTGIGREKTVEDKLAAVQAKLKPGRSGALLYQGEERAKLQAEADALQKQIDDARNAARTKSEAAEKNRQQNSAYDLIKGYSRRARVNELDEKEKAVRAFVPENADQAANQKDALKQIAEQRKNLATSKEDRAAAQKLLEEQYRAGIAALEGLQKLEQDKLRAHLAHLDSLAKQGVISQKELIDQKLAAQLSANQKQIEIATAEAAAEQARGKLGDVEKRRDEIKRLQADRDTLTKAAADAQAELTRRQIEALDQWKKSQAEATSQIQFEISLIGKNAEEIERLTYARKVDAAVRAATKNADGTDKKDVDTSAYENAGRDEVAAHERAIAAKKTANDAYQADWKNGIQDGMRDYVKSAQTAAGAAGQALTDSFNIAGQALANFVTTGKFSFKDFARSILADLAQIYAKQVIVWAVKQATGYANGGVLGTPAGTSVNAANGAVFGGGNVRNFANGGVYDRPTYMQLANGGTALVAEAGEEAAMPLKRMRNGKLGVAAQGGGGSVVNHINVSVKTDGDDPKRHGEQIGRAIEERMKQVALQTINEQKLPGGAFNG